MAPPSPSETTPAGRPGPVRISSFSPQTSQTSQTDHDNLRLPKRAHTFQNGSLVDNPLEDDADTKAPDAFETGEHSEAEDGPETTRASIELDDLPIELITMTDSFVESLGAKVHKTPPNIARLSQLFQDFYATASSHIATHISALASRQSRDASPAPSISSISSAASRLRSKAASLSSKDQPALSVERQMITAEEMAERKRARKALEAKRSLLEEAIERRLCEGIYDRIYRHRSTQDEAQDDKLRSKTAALALVGIGPADLGVELWGESVDNAEPGSAGDKSQEIQMQMGAARKDLIRMGQSRYPLGKLNQLKAAHKSIVDTLAEFHPSASADEIMPMLIYALITLPPENLHVISDLNFIQNFRWETKLTGEAAYCLTNLEAAVSFLQTVDLATLRADEHLSGPAKSTNQQGISRAETFPPAYSQGLAAPSQSATSASTENATASKPAASPSGLKATTVLRNRRLSDLVNTPAQAFGAASDAVLNSADQSLKNISNSLGESYNFLIGKLKERQDGPQESIVVPRTLDEARKLVSTPPPDDEDNVSGTGSAGRPEETEQLKPPTVPEDRVLNLIGGRRDRSVDSALSGRSAASSSKKVLFAEESKTATLAPAPGPQSPAMLDQMRSLGNTFNPISRLSSIGMMRGFGRTTPTPAPASAPAAAAAAATPPPSITKEAPKEVVKPTDGGDLAAAFPDIAAVLPPKNKPKVAPPNKRFMQLENPGDLKLSEVLDLLKDYRRLAGALDNMGAFEEK